MELPVWSHGSRIGTARVEAEGLYWRVEIRCSGDLPYLSRVYSDGRSLGILAPEGESWTLRRQLSRRSWPLTERSLLSLDAQPQPQPFSGFVGEYPAEGGFLEGQTLYFLPEPGKPFPIPALFCFFEPKLRQGTLYLALRERPEWPFRAVPGANEDAGQNT